MIKTYQHPTFGSIRTLLIDDKLWFVGKDIAEKIGYSRARDAIAKYVHEKDKKYAQIPASNLSSTRKMIVINENGVTSLMRSKLPYSKEFWEWIKATVLVAEKAPLGKEQHIKNQNAPKKEPLENIICDMDEDTKANLLLGCMRLISFQKDELDRQKVITAELQKQINLHWQAIQGLQKQVKKSDKNDAQTLRKTIHAVINRYASRAKKGEWKDAWDDFKFAIRANTYGSQNINIDDRLYFERRNGNGKATIMSVLLDKELPEALKIAIGLCNKNNVYIKDLI